MEERRKLTVRTLRPGDPPLELPLWQGSTPAERMGAVWELTQQCLAWQANEPVKP